MVIKAFHAGRVEIIAGSTVKAQTVPRALAAVPGGLYPMRSSAFELDEYRLLSGWPVPVPRYDIRVDTLVSGDGAMLSNRETPTSVLTGANYRWVADDNYYDETALSWVPIQGGSPTWVGDPAHLPTLIHDYEYQINDERFTDMSALNFDSDTADYLTSDLSRVLSTKLGFTLIAVMSPNSVYGNDVDVPFNGLWSNPASPNFTSMDITIERSALQVALSDKPKQKGISMATAEAISAPSYLAVVINRPTTTMYLGQGPSNILAKSISVGPAAAQFNPVVSLGRWSGDLLHNADMALFDLGLYANPLSRTDVHNEFAMLAQIYGGS